jgi:hypothetical protein
MRKIKIDDTSSYKYLREQLDLSERFTTDIIKNLPLENGNIFALIEGDYNPKNLHYLDRPILNNRNQNSGLIPVENNVIPVLINAIIKYISSDPNNFCIIEEPVAKPNDKHFLTVSIPYKILEEEIYYIFSSKENDFQKINEAIKLGTGHYFLCILSKARDIELESTDSIKINKDFILKLLFQVEMIIVKAYDGQGYLIWEKHSLNS